MTGTAGTAYPFDSQSVGESQWNAMAKWWKGAGVVRGELNELATLADSSGMQVKVPSGRFWFTQFAEWSTQTTLAIAASHASLNRIDRVVVRYDYTNNQVLLDVLTGTAGASPAAPSLTNSGTTWEFSLAQVAVDAGVTTIAAGKITDERSNPAVGGFAFAPCPMQNVLSTTRPTSFSPGGLIYETNTTLVYVNTGTYTVPVWTQLTTSSVSFAAPALTLTTANAAGAAGTAIRTDASILVYDATAPVTQAMGDAAAAGNTATAARRNHTHGMPGFGTPVTQAMGDAAADGAATTVARSNHVHGMPAFGTPALTLSTSNGAGAAATALRTDAQVAIFDGTAPVTQNFSDVAATGSAAFSARRDHVHGMPAGSSTVRQLKPSDESVTSSTVLQNDDTFSLPGTNPSSWVGMFVLFVQGATGGDIKYALKCPSGSDILTFTSIRAPAAVAATPWTPESGGLIQDGTTPATETGGTLGSNAANTVTVIIHFSVQFQSNGNMVLQWAQNGSSGTATTVLAGSYLVAWKV